MRILVRRRGAAPPRLWATLAFGASVLTSSPSRAQGLSQPSRSVGGRAEVSAGSEVEQYLRVLQTLGRVPAYPWGGRRFTPFEVDRIMPTDSGHPWATRYDFRRGRPTDGVRQIRPTSALRLNSSFPIGDSDGAVWAGRGLTTSISGGVQGRWGRVALTLAPIAFVAQNRPYALIPPVNGSISPYGDPCCALDIDLPQRFGEGAYRVLDGGQSMLDIEGLGVSLAAGTANYAWGPGQRYPLILGTNAAGFPHVALGTGRPIDAGFAYLHGRILWGSMQQSEYANRPTAEPYRSLYRPTRFINALSLSIQPKGLRDLELGVTRFTHAPMPDGAIPVRYFTRVIGNPIKTRVEARNGVAGGEQLFDGDNQIASLFARWVFPSSGFEAYLEYAKEDYLWDARYVLLSPDEQVGRLFGLRKAWMHRLGGLTVLRAEMVNYQQQNVDRARGGSAFYIHASGSNQGHTNRGQLLGAPLAAASAAGAEIAMDRYRMDGRFTVAWRRDVLGEQQTLQLGGLRNPVALWVRHAVTAERLWFRGPLDVLVGGTYAMDVNRQFGRDRGGASVYLSLTRKL